MNIDKLLENNAKFVAENGGKQYETTKFPDRKIAIVSCMDTRLTLLLPAALGLKNGDVMLITNAGGVISDMYGDTVRSILVAIYELGVEEVMVIGHTDCGAANLDPREMRHLIAARGCDPEKIRIVEDAGIDIDRWLTGHGDTPAAVVDSVWRLRRHPLIPTSVTVRGFVMNTVTGALEEVYKSVKNI